MLTDRYDPVDLFAMLPGLCLQMEPTLAQLDQLLDDDALFCRVKADLARRHPHTLTRGRHSTPVEVILRMLVVMRLYGWSFAQTEYFVAASLVLRQFCRLYLQPAPDDTTLIRWAQLIGPATLEQLNERVVAPTRQRQVTRGRKLRVDTTVVQTNIHYPSDSAILASGVQVLSRWLRRAKGLAGQVPTLAELGKAAFRCRTRSIRRLAQRFYRASRKKDAERIAALKAVYTRQLQVAQATLQQARRVAAALQEATEPAAARVREALAHFLPLVEQARLQAWRRVIAGEALPAQEKLLSLFEPHTQLITRHKAGQKVEFGRKLWLDEVEGGIITRWAFLPEGGGTDEPYLPASLQAHHERFGKAPDLLAGDRGIHSGPNEQLAKAAGVRRVVLPWSGKPSPERKRYEQQRWFRRGMRYRAGMEGRIHVLQRDFGLERCLYHGAEGMGRWTGWGIVTHNLVQIARHQVAHQAG